MAGEKLLLTGVFGPYGVSDEYAAGLGMQMELLNNQITREQGVHSPRQSYWTFPLYLLAENLAVSSTVLDFPSWREFTRELKKGYTHVGINFIVPNVMKARRMAEHIRRHHPAMKIILGGYGTTIPDLETIVPHDAKCRGEGVRWLREYFGEDPAAPLRHPVIIGPAYERIYGFSGRPSGGILMPGVGCENGCKFCVTSHNFNKQYLPLLRTGGDIFTACRRMETAVGARGFSVMDENFLKNPQRARELLEVMTEHNKPYVFDIFSSAEVIATVGVDFLVRLGVHLVWIGVESKRSAFEKTKGIDLSALIAELRAKGIAVNASAILFQDHHDEQTLREDIDYVIGLDSDLVQFMNYTPLPATALTAELSAEGRLNDTPYRFLHGAGGLAFVHPHINDRRKHVRYLREAFRRKFLAHGPGVLSMAQTAIAGYRRAVADHARRMRDGLAWNPATLRYERTDTPVRDEFMESRIRMMRKIATNIRLVLTAARVYAPNGAARKKAKAVARDFTETLGPAPLPARLASLALVATAAVEWLRTRAARLAGRESVIYQPPSKRVEYPRAISLTKEHATMRALLDMVPEFVLGAMARRNISVRALARRAGISPALVRGIVAGRRHDVTAHTIEAVLAALGYRIVLE